MGDAIARLLGDLVGLVLLFCMLHWIDKWVGDGKL